MRKGFTLIELLLVIGILSILAVIVIVVLNPAQLLAQARDARRMSDLNSVKSAIGLYLTSVDNPIFGETAISTASTTCGLTSGCTVCNVASCYRVDGTGWVGVNLTGTSGGSPLASLPRDPVNNEVYQYAYDGNNAAKTFELNGRLESEKHRALMITDGGDDSTCSTFTEATCYYEVGTDPGLDL